MYLVSKSESSKYLPTATVTRWYDLTTMYHLQGLRSDELHSRMVIDSKVIKARGRVGKTTEAWGILREISILPSRNTVASLHREEPQSFHR